MGAGNKWEISVPYLLLNFAMNLKLLEGLKSINKAHTQITEPTPECLSAAHEFAFLTSSQ